MQVLDGSFQEGAVLKGKLPNQAVSWNLYSSDDCQRDRLQLTCPLPWYTSDAHVEMGGDWTCEGVRATFTVVASEDPDTSNNVASIDEPNLCGTGTDIQVWTNAWRLNGSKGFLFSVENWDERAAKSATLTADLETLATDWILLDGGGGDCEFVPNGPRTLLQCALGDVEPATMRTITVQVPPGTCGRRMYASAVVDALNDWKENEYEYGSDLRLRVCDNPPDLSLALRQKPAADPSQVVYVARITNQGTGPSDLAFLYFDSYRPVTWTTTSPGCAEYAHEDYYGTYAYVSCEIGEIAPGAILRIRFTTNMDDCQDLYSPVYASVFARKDTAPSNDGDYDYPEC